MIQFLEIVGAVGIAIAGGTAVLAAISKWFGQIWAEKLLAKDRAKYEREIEEVRSKYHHEVEQNLHLLRDQLEKGQFVYRMQFEAEFKIYVDLWRAIVEVKDATLALRPILEYSEGMSQEEHKQVKLERLNAAYRKYRDCHIANKPFFAQTVFDAARVLTDHIIEETLMISEQADIICEAIRTRIGIIGQASEVEAKGEQ